jgi:PKD repeat protein
MTRPTLAHLVSLLAVSVMLGGCGWNPLGIPDHFEIDTTSELGPDTLDRIDDLNDTLERGVEIGPETRRTIEELNKTIADGLEFGFTEETLARVDVLLKMVEDGVGLKVGLDSETNATVNNLIETIDDAPDQWEDTVTEIIETLEDSSTNVASKMADEVRSLMDEARLNTQYVTAAVGTEFRCNVDFLGARAGDTVDQFIGRTIVGRLRAIISGDEEKPEVPVPWVCQIIPDQIDLTEVGEKLVFETAVVKISGYNYLEANKPMAYIVDEAGQRVESAQLYPFLSSPYQLQLNLQNLDFSAIPQRSRVVFEWPSAGTNYALAVVFPGEEVPPTAVAQAEVTISVASVDVRRGPGDTYHVIGRAESGAKYLVSGQNGDGSWLQIDYDGEEGWIPASVGTRNEFAAPVVSIPLPPPTADFTMDRTSGGVPLEVHFVDCSTQAPIRWEWNFGGGTPSFEQSPTHTFQTAGTYQVTLRVENSLGFATVTKTVEVTQATIVFRPPQRTVVVVPFNTPTPAFPAGSILFASYPSLGDRIHYNTSILTSTYDCGVVGLAALDGDIDENGVANIIYANTVEEGGTWWINAEFHTHEDHETWNIGLMCLKKGSTEAYRFYRRIRVSPDDEETIDLAHLNIPAGHYCGVAGFAAWTGDINESGAGEHILKVFAQKNASTGNWELTANFRTHGTEEYWDVDLLCVYDNPTVFFHQDFFTREGGRAFDTNVSSRDYACGIVGMAGLNGDIQENGDGPILRVFPYIGANQNWYVMADFRSHGVDELWNVNLLCARRTAVELRGNWAEGWVR